MDTRKTGLRTAFALHYVADYRRWNLKMQYTNYNLRPVRAPGEDRHLVTMAAYGSSYRIASRADIYTVSLSYRIPVNRLFLDDICLENVTGCSLAMGKVFAYIDYAVGRNHAWLGDIWDEAFARGTEDNWNVRFNINIGYYF